MNGGLDDRESIAELNATIERLLARVEALEGGSQPATATAPLLPPEEDFTRRRLLAKLGGAAFAGAGLAVAGASLTPGVAGAATTFGDGGTTGDGVDGVANKTDKSGVYGHNDTSGFGVYGKAAGLGVGVHGQSGKHGVVGYCLPLTATPTGFSGVLGASDSAIGVEAYSRDHDDRRVFAPGRTNPGRRHLGAEGRYGGDRHAERHADRQSPAPTRVTSPPTPPARWPSPATADLTWFGANQTLSAQVIAPLSSFGQMTIHNGMVGGSSAAHVVFDAKAYLI